MLGYIYKITVGDLGFYIGSTHDFDERLTVHTHNIKTHSQKLYKAIRDNDGEFVMEEFCYHLQVVVGYLSKYFIEYHHIWFW